MACDLTAFLRRAVHATTAANVLPGIAYNGPGSFGQGAMGMHVPTTIAPTVMLPNWQGSEHRLHKRGSIKTSEWASFVVMHCADKCTTAKEEVLYPPPLRKPSNDGKHGRERTIPAEIAAKDPTASPGEVIQRMKQVQGFKNKKKVVGFEVRRLHPPCLCR